MGQLAAALHHICIASEDPEQLAAFYRRALGFTFETRDGAFIGRAKDRSIVLVHGEAKTLRYAAFEVRSEEQLEALRRRLAKAGHSEATIKSPLFQSGSVAVKDLDGNHILFGLASGQDSGSYTGVGSCEARLQHLVVASSHLPEIVSFYTDVLGFVVSDNVLDDQEGVRTSFLRCSNEHHSFAVFQAAENRFDHHCYEAGDWSLIRDWCDHMANEHIPIQWGPGRHGPGNNLFMFVHDRDGNWIEISAELEIVDEDRPAGTWPHEERTLNKWGRGILRS